MKLCRYGVAGAEKPAIVGADGARRDCSAHFRDWDARFFREDGLERLSQLLTERPDDLPRVPGDERWGSPVPRPGKVLCIGLNYRDHARESGLEVPPEPVLFMKAAQTVVGPFDDVLIPRGSEKTDWEVELGVVIGREARYLEDLDEAARAIAGYCVSNDVSERAFQMERHGQWTKGKSCDTFNPLGPWLATPEEVDPGDLRLTCDVSGARMQDGTTRDMVYGPAFLVHYVSQFMTLEPGDLITTGTPAGVGLGQEPPRYLRAGDVMELSITGLGTQRQTCRDA